MNESPQEDENILLGMRVHVFFKLTIRDNVTNEPDEHCNLTHERLAIKVPIISKPTYSCCLLLGGDPLCDILVQISSSMPLAIVGLSCSGIVINLTISQYLYIYFLFDFKEFSGVSSKFTPIPIKSIQDHLGTVLNLRKKNSKFARISNRRLDALAWLYLSLLQ